MLAFQWAKRSQDSNRMMSMMSGIEPSLSVMSCCCPTLGKQVQRYHGQLTHSEKSDHLPPVCIVFFRWRWYLMMKTISIDDFPWWWPSGWSWKIPKLSWKSIFSASGSVASAPFLDGIASFLVKQLLNPCCEKIIRSRRHPRKGASITWRKLKSSIYLTYMIHMQLHIFK